MAVYGYSSSSTATEDVIKFLVSSDDVINTIAAVKCFLCGQVSQCVDVSLKVLPCFHTACTTCLNDLCRHSCENRPETSLMTFSCSVCQTEIAVQRSGTGTSGSEAFFTIKELRRFISGVMTSLRSNGSVLLSNNNYDDKTMTPLFKCSEKGNVYVAILCDHLNNVSMELHDTVIR